MRNTIYTQFPRTNRNINKGDIWLAYFPYRELGNMEKLRPVYVKEIMQNKYLCYMITSNKNKGKLLNIELGSKNRFKNINTKKSYLTNKKAIIKEEKFYSKLKANVKEI